MITLLFVIAEQHADGEVARIEWFGQHVLRVWIMDGGKIVADRAPKHRL